MAAGGMAPADVLVATTRSAAELLGVETDSGTLTPGKRADIVVVDGDPFDSAGLKDHIRRSARAQPGLSAVPWRRLVGATRSSGSPSGRAAVGPATCACSRRQRSIPCAVDPKHGC
jgi:N-acyl-D-aspartate/D-glutamate deacylase